MNKFHLCIIDSVDRICNINFGTLCDCSVVFLSLAARKVALSKKQTRKRIYLKFGIRLQLDERSNFFLPTNIRSNMC